MWVCNAGVREVAERRGRGVARTALTLAHELGGGTSRAITNP